MIYEWSNPEYWKYARYEGKNEIDDMAISWDCPVLGNPLPPLEKWRKPTLTQYVSDEVKQQFEITKSSKMIADCVSSANIHFISQKAVDALADIWDKHTTLYPVNLDDKPNEQYYMVVVHTVIDCIDRDKSKGTLHLHTEKGQNGLFDGITQWVFREEEIKDNYMFVLPDSAATVYLLRSLNNELLKQD